MSTFELKKISENEYPSILKAEKLKGLSFKIYYSLEGVVKRYENLILTKQEYDDQPSRWKSRLVEGRLTYKSSQDQSLLEIGFTGGFKRSSSGILEGSYNKLDVQFKSDKKGVDTKVVFDLVNKFKSFEELIQRSQENIDRIIFSEE